MMLASADFFRPALCATTAAARGHACSVRPPSGQLVTPARRDLQICEAASSSALTALGAPTWSEFAAAASGEWSGISATYNAHFEPQEIPYQYVPDAFREWGQVPKDWHTQCSCLADDDGMVVKLKRLMPIVGCEADAVAYNEESRTVLRSEPSHRQEPKTVLPDGSYSTGPRILDDLRHARIEHCLAAPEAGRRLRFVFNLKRGESQGAWSLDTLEQHLEQRDGDYNGGTSLSACGYDMSSVTETPVLEAAALNPRPWRVVGGTAWTLDSDDAFCSIDTGVPPTLHIPEGRVLLHGSAWCHVSSTASGGNSSSEDDGALTLTAGWLVSEGECRVATHSFAEDRLTELALLIAGASA